MWSVEKRTWINDDGMEIPVQLLSAAFDQVDTDIQEEHVRVISPIKKLLGDDLTLVAIIQCVILFTPENASPGTRALTASVQDKYIILLKRYLEARNSWKDAFDIFSQLLNCMSAAKPYTVKHSKAFLQCDASRVEPLLLEMFDIAFTPK